jgi:peptide/nickel transport system substrate-binding protein
VLLPSETVTNDHCTYIPNKYYYNKSQQKWGKIVTKRIADPNALLAALRTGQIDIAEGHPDVVEPAEAAGIKVIHIKQRILGLYFLDHLGKINPATGDVRVRQALNYAVDRKTIARALYGKYAVPTSSRAPYTGITHDPKTFNYYDYNPSKARSLLAAAGYPNGFKIKVLSIAGGLGIFKSDVLVQSICKYWGDVGVECDLRLPVAADYAKERATNTYSAILMISASDAVNVMYISTLKLGSPLGDQHGWHDEAIDKLYRKAERLTYAQGASTWRQLLNRTITQAYYVPVVSPGLFIFHTKRVTNVYPSPLDDKMHIMGWAPAS